MDLLAGALETRQGLPPRREFIRKYVDAPQPVLAHGLTKNWRAMDLWTFDWFRRNHGDAIVPQGNKRTISVREAMDRVEKCASGGPMYYLLMDLQCAPGLKSDFSYPDFHTLEPLARTVLWIGPAGTRSPVHYDDGHTFFTQIVGRKRIQLYSPEATQYFLPRVRYQFFSVYLNEVSHSEDGLPHGQGDLELLLDGNHPKPYVDFIIEPGETVFIPSHWEHRVTSLEPSVSVSYQWMPIAALARRLPKLAVQWLGGATALVEWRG